MLAARVLLVEDERIVALHLKQQLTKLGYEVPAVAASGDRALQHIRETRPDLVLMDINIDGPADGIETAARIPADCQVPVIYLTAYAEEATLERARATRPYGYLLKPFSERELHATIQMVLERRATEAALKSSEERLRQAQKMESVGQLAGGIAHDFNNLLNIIQGNLELIQEGAQSDPEQQSMIRDALRAVDRGAQLTRQLLAYSRRQPLAPAVVSLNELVAGLAGLLRRTLGETIQITTRLPGSLWTTRIDPNQLENALINLAVNARDAMPGGGTLLIEGENVALDQAQAEQLIDVAPGRYVCLAVTDSGVGMPREVVERALEPFFTTKPAGQGTGLGLSMVFGFVKQSDGHVRIYSEVGRGTTVRLYLPAVGAGAAAAAAAAAEAGPLPVARTGELVLVVEDDPMVRKLTLRLLASLGYRTLEAGDGPTGLKLLERTAGVDLLLTDVMLPGGLDGPALAREAQVRRPGLKVMHMSGYPASAISASGVLDPGLQVLTKPFRKAELAEKLRLALDQPAVV